MTPQDLIFKARAARVEVLEDRIRYAIDLLKDGYINEAASELDRALHDPDSKPHASDCAVHNAPALPVGPCDCHDDATPF